MPSVDDGEDTRPDLRRVPASCGDDVVEVIHLRAAYTSLLVR